MGHRQGGLRLDRIEALRSRVCRLGILLRHHILAMARSWNLKAMPSPSKVKGHCGWGTGHGAQGTLRAFGGVDRAKFPPPPNWARRDELGKRAQGLVGLQTVILSNDVDSEKYLLSAEEESLKSTAPAQEI
jgi:hypothetical protein